MLKNKLVPLAALLLGLGQTHMQANDNDIEPTKDKYTAPFTLTPIVLDGSLSEWGGVNQIVDPKFAVPKGSGRGPNPNYVLFEEYNGGTWTGPDDQTSAVQVAYDADNVYFGFVVTDDYHENAAHSAWNGDSVQLMIANGARNAQIALYNYALGGVEGATDDTIILHEAGPGGTEAIVTRNAATKKTYYEIKLPAASLGLTTLTPGTKFGLGMAINDGDELTPGQKGWGGLGAHSIVFGKTPSETAEVTLGANTPTIELLGIGTEALLGGDLTDPENDGDEAAGPTSPTWNWAGITSNIEPGFGGGEFSFNIFDNKVGGGNDKWCCDDPTEANPYFVAVQFPNPVSITHFTITSGNDTPSRRPTKFQIQGSQDGVNYSAIFVQNGSSATDIWDAENQVAKFTLPIPSVPFRYIRYFVTETPGTLHQINEIEYFGTFGGTAVAFYSGINPTITSFSFRLTDAGTSVIDPASVKLAIDGTNITIPTPTKINGVIDVKFTPPSVFLPGSAHTYTITAKDGVGNNINSEGAFTTAQYAFLTAAHKVTPNTAKPGFLWNVVQNNAFGANNNVRPVQQLAGLLGKNFADPNAVGAAIGAGTPGANENLPISFEIESVINLDQDAGGGAGNFPDNLVLPGIPGLGDAGQTDGIAAEVITNVELPAGLTTMIVNSDDGFRTTAGNIGDVLQGQLAGQFVGGRGASDTAFTIFAESAGVYPIRTIWYEGGGGANIELLTLKADGTKVLINDTANGGLKAFRAIVGAAATAVTSVSPVPGAVRVLGDATIEAIIQEGANPIVGAISLKVDGATVTPVITKTGNQTKVSFKPASPLTPGNHSATLAFNAGADRADTWSFVVPSSTKDVVAGYVGLILGGAVYTDDGKGHTGKPGDRAIEINRRANSSVTVPNGTFLNGPAATDTITLAFWQFMLAPADQSAFWGVSPSSPQLSRGFQAHTPWSNNRIYFDSAGCCTAEETRIDADIATFADFTDSATFWPKWHLFGFSKNGTVKQIWIDGKLFLEGAGLPLPTDFTELVIGAAADNTFNFNGSIDDFAVYGSALTEADYAKLLAGTLPTALGAAAKLVAYWPFDDKAAVVLPPPALSVVRNANGSVTVTFEGKLETSATVGGPYTPVAGATSPLTVTPDQAAQFARARR